MVSVATTQSSALALLALSKPPSPPDAVSFLSSPLFSAGSDNIQFSASIQNAIVKAFLSRADLQASFAAEYGTAMQTRTRSEDQQGSASHSPQGLTSANSAHIALYETIMKNRDSFPVGGFWVRTELGDGASVTTRIPPVAPMSASRQYGSTDGAGPSAGWLEMQSRIVGALALGPQETAAVLTADISARVRVEGGYLAG